MESSLPVIDNQKIIGSPFAKKYLTNETIYLSVLILKYNKKKLRKRRVLVLTDKNMYLLRKSDWFSTLKKDIKIPYEKVEGVIVATKGFEWTFQLAAHSDIRLFSPKQRQPCLIFFGLLYHRFHNSDDLCKFFFLAENQTDK